jgi:hypothetical protein
VPASRFAHRILAAGVIALALMAAAPPAAAAAEDQAALELKARTLFATGEYKQALEIYGRLYAETMQEQNTAVQTPTCP